MHPLIGRIFAIAFAASVGTGAVPASAQSASSYDLSNLKSYDAPIAPPANGLSTVIRSENQASAPHKFKLGNGLTVTMGGYGEFVTGSTMHR